MDILNDFTTIVMNMDHLPASILKVNCEVFMALVGPIEYSKRLADAIREQKQAEQQRQDGSDDTSFSDSCSDASKSSPHDCTTNDSSLRSRDQPTDSLCSSITFESTQEEDYFCKPKTQTSNETRTRTDALSQHDSEALTKE